MSYMLQQVTHCSCDPWSPLHQCIACCAHVQLGLQYGITNGLCNAAMTIRRCSADCTLLHQSLRFNAQWKCCIRAAHLLGNVRLCSWCAHNGWQALPCLTGAAAEHLQRSLVPNRTMGGLLCSTQGTLEVRSIHGRAGLSGHKLA